MSFFGYLLSGAAEGVGREMQREEAADEKRAAALALQRDKAQSALELQRQRAEDRADRERDNIMLRAEMRAGQGGGGNKDFNLFQAANSAKTPEEQARLVETVRAFQGDDAANVMSRIFGGGANVPGTQVNPTAGDFARFDRGQTEEVPATRVVPGSVDTEKGRLGLQRLMALAMDPAKMKPYAEGEAQILRNDVGALTVGQALRTTGADLDGLNEALTPLNPKAGLDHDKNSLTAERIAAQREAEAGKNQRNAANIAVRQGIAEGKYDAAREAADRKLVNDRTAPKAARDEAQARLRKLDQERAKPGARGPRAGNAAAAYADWLARNGQ